MKITEALRILQSAPPDREVYRVFLACGFVPLHLETLLAAHLQQSLPQRRVSVVTGTYGNTSGSLEEFPAEAVHAVAVALEWPDADPRLDYRRSGAWGPRAMADAVAASRAAWDRIAAAIERIPAGLPVAVCPPTLPLPPAFHTPGWQKSSTEWMLENALADFQGRLFLQERVMLVNARRLEEDSPLASRYDFKADMAAGLPYTVAHADAVAASLARLLAPPAPKKGLITDLDDTLWSGVVGEIGPEHVGWDLASKRPIHGIYQRLLAALAEEGTLLAVASKNEAETARLALEREDLLLPVARLFPLEINWQPKSASIGRILQAWNVGAGDAVFVDDSPMELAEVAAAHPGILCLRFPKDDSAEALKFIRQLRDLFGKSRLSAEDSLRLESIRQGVRFHEAAGTAAAPEAFLEQAAAAVHVDFDPVSGDPRILDLVNKTNQFNLNGIRYTAADWRRNLEREGGILMVVSYEDKFGPLGKIAVLQGRLDGAAMTIDTWVMSCRAFSRRIEHRCLEVLFRRLGVEELELQFAPTPKNRPLQEFFAGLLGEAPAGVFRLTRDRFTSRCPTLWHQVTERASTEHPWTQSQIA